MIIFVCDANILIDLLQIDLLNAFLKLKWAIYVPQIITRRMAHNKLTRLMEVNKRLPKTEFERLLRRYRKSS